MTWSSSDILELIGTAVLVGFAVLFILAVGGKL